MGMQLPSCSSKPANVVTVNPFTLLLQCSRTIKPDTKDLCNVWV